MNLAIYEPCGPDIGGGGAKSEASPTQALRGAEKLLRGRHGGSGGGVDSRRQQRQRRWWWWWCVRRGRVGGVGRTASPRGQKRRLTTCCYFRETAAAPPVENYLQWYNLRVVGVTCFRKKCVLVGRDTNCLAVILYFQSRWCAIYSAITVTPTTASTLAPNKASCDGGR